MSNDLAAGSFYSQHTAAVSGMANIQTHTHTYTGMDVTSAEMKQRPFSSVRPLGNHSTVPSKIMLRSTRQTAVTEIKAHAGTFWRYREKHQTTSHVCTDKHTHTQSRGRIDVQMSTFRVSAFSCLCLDVLISKCANK